MDFTNKQLQDIDDEHGFVNENGGWEDVRIVERGEWEVEHKYESSWVVFEYQNKYYRFYLSRWGSYWQGYEYDTPDGFEEVELAQKTVNYWRAI